MSLLLSTVPVAHTRPALNPLWEDTCSKFAQAKVLVRPGSTGGIDRQLHLPGIELQNSISTLCHDSGRLLHSKGAIAEVLNQGAFFFLRKQSSPVIPANFLRILLYPFAYLVELAYYLSILTHHPC